MPDSANFEESNLFAPPDLQKSAAALFDEAFYREQNPDVAAGRLSPFDHFWTVGRFEGRNPSILFDGLFYRSQVRGRLLEADPVSDYIRHGAGLGRSPHPLFDPTYYVQTADDPAAKASPLEHYMSRGWRRGLSPHPLFDPAYYALSTGGPLTGVDPLAHYLTHDDHQFSPHYLFSDAIYVASLTGKSPRHSDVLRGDAPLTHYARTGFRLRAATHPLFDAEYYLGQLEEWARANPGSMLDTSRELITDPLRHYVQTGWTLGISPTPFFDPAFYRRQIGGDLAGDPLRHYLRPSGFSRLSPHPALDLHYYAGRANILLDDSPSILHLLASPESDRVSPHPFLDVGFYNGINRDLAKAGESPILHFLRQGMDRDVSPNAYYSADYVRNRHCTESFASESALSFYLGSEMPRRLRVVFVSHDASLTGAPGTVLRLIEDFAQLSNVECFAIVGNGGPRVDDFRRAAHTLVLNTPFYSAPVERLRSAARQLLSITAGNEPVVAIVNSAESRAMGAELAAAGIPVITLVHEAADLYPPGAFEPIVRDSSKVVFGSHYVLERAQGAVALRDDATLVRGQGLQQDSIGLMPRAEARRKVLKELGLPPDVFLVLGCGTIDYRKGTDLFVTAALDYLERPGVPKACFVWVGEGHDRMLRSFVTTQIGLKGRELDIRFVGARADVEPYFVAGDAFLMTSRADPFPCVCQEAMATGLPIIAFAEGGGTIEMIGDEAGFCVPLPETGAMADKLALLAADPKLRRRLGDRGRTLVREKWRAVDYAEFMAGLAAEVAGVDRRALGEPIARPTFSQPRVFVLFDEWLASAEGRAAEALTNELNLRGLSAEIVVSRGRFSALRQGDRECKPQAPHRYLQPRGIQRADGGQVPRDEVVASLLRLVRETGPCLLLVMSDPAAATIGPLLPGTAALALVLPSAAEHLVEAAYRSGPEPDLIIAGSQLAAAALLELNPGLQAKLATVPMPVGSGQPAGTAARNGLYVHADLSDRDQCAAVVELGAGLRRLGVELECSVHSQGGANVPGDVRKYGIAPAQLLVTPSAAQLAGCLSRSRFAVFLDGAQAGYGLIAEAIAAGAIPVVVDPTDEQLALGAVIVPFRGLHASAICRELVRLSASAPWLESQAIAGQSWLAENTSSLQHGADRYAALLRGMFEKLALAGAEAPSP